MPRRVLLLLSQTPFDPASGAARSLLTICRLLASEGFPVAALGTTATEAAQPLPVLPLLAQFGCHAAIDRRGAVGKGCPVLRFSHRGMAFTLMDTGRLGQRDWDFPHGLQFARLLADTLDAFRPDIVLTYGGSPPEQSRREICREFGAVIVFGLRNLAYSHALAFEHVDAVLTCSRFLTDHYAGTIGLVSTSIPSPVDPEDALAPSHNPRYFTFVNPTPNKGVYFFVRLAEQIGAARPDIPLQVIAARGTHDQMIVAGSRAGIDLRAHPNLTLSPLQPHPRDIFATARSVLVPSVWAEPFGRIAAEAVLNGIPPLVSSRGGLPEACAGAGFVLPLPRDLTPESATPVPASAVAPWLEVMIRLHDDPSFYEQACATARRAARVFDPRALAKRYAEYFSHVHRADGSVVQRRNARVPG